MSTLAQAQEVVPAGTWEVDPVHSQVGFAVDYMAGTFHGTFSPFEATLEVAEDGSATLTGKAAVESVKVQDENLTAHLMTPDFFDAEQAPQLTFTSSAIDLAGREITVAGKLTIKGETQPVELAGSIGGPVVDPYGRERVNLELETTVDRTAFGIDWNAPLASGEPALSNLVELTAELALVKQ
jgi:polyisoprenoid-binding protein YceI